MFQVNLVGVTHLTQRVLPGMLARRQGTIVNNASISGYAHFPAASTYAASKAGIVGFTESLRRELRGTGVHAMHLVTPGVATDMLSATDEVYGRHMDTSGWDRVPPREWAAKVVGAIEADRRVLGPGGRSALGDARRAPDPRSCSTRSPPGRSADGRATERRALAATRRASAAWPAAPARRRCAARQSPPRNRTGTAARYAGSARRSRARRACPKLASKLARQWRKRLYVVGGDVLEPRDAHVRAPLDGALDHAPARADSRSGRCRCS